MFVTNYIGISGVLLLLVLPYLCSSLGASSWAIGSVLAACVCLTILPFKQSKLFIPWRGLLLTVAFLFCNILLTSLLYNQFPSAAQLASLAISIILLIYAALFASWLSLQELKKITKILSATLTLIIVAAFLSELCQFHFLSSSKPILFFSEPSHFAVAITPLATFLSITIRNWKVIILIIVLVSFALYFENATLLFSAIVCAFILLIRIPVHPLVVFATSITLLSICCIAILNNDYFAQRLLLDNSNLSSLVYLRGLESAQASLSTPPFLGVGFQMMGDRIYETNAITLIRQLSHQDLNSADGGFVAAKFVTEFGVVGLLSLAIYLHIVTKSVSSLFIRIRRGHASSLDCIYLSSLSALTIQLFVRGAGYLGPFVCYALLALWFRPTLRKTHSINCTTAALTGK